MSFFLILAWSRKIFRIFICKSWPIVTPFCSLVVSCNLLDLGFVNFLFSFWALCCSNMLLLIQNRAFLFCSIPALIPLSIHSFHPFEVSGSGLGSGSGSNPRGTIIFVLFKFYISFKESIALSFNIIIISKNYFRNWVY